MNRRLLPILTLVLVALAATDHFSRGNRDRQRSVASHLRPLLDDRLEIVPDRVRRIQLQLGTRPQTWTYIREGRSWRYPAYFNAFARGDRIDHLLRSLLEGVGTVVDGGGSNHVARGLGHDRALKVNLFDGDGRVLLASWIGRGIPGVRSTESYIRRAGDDTVFHWHANPRHALDGGDPPIIDRLVLPKALARKPFAAISINGVSGGSVALHREDLPIEIRDDGIPMPRAPGSTHVWLASFDGGPADTCRIENVHAYTSFLRRLSFARLNDPAIVEQQKTADGISTIELTDEDGVIDLLRLIPVDGGERLLYNGSTRLLSTIDGARAALLIPTREALLDSLPKPSPYRLAQPN